MEKETENNSVVGFSYLDDSYSSDEEG